MCFWLCGPVGHMGVVVALSKGLPMGLDFSGSFRNQMNCQGFPLGCLSPNLKGSSSGWTNEAKTRTSAHINGCNFSASGSHAALSHTLAPRRQNWEAILLQRTDHNGAGPPPGAQGTGGSNSGLISRAGWVSCPCILHSQLPNMAVTVECFLDIETP